MLKLTETTLGGLLCRVLDPEARGTEPPKQVVVLNHGFGAPGHDLVGLGPAFYEMNPALLKTTRFVFPEAPHAAMGAPGGRAWWHIDMMAIQEMLMRGERRQQRDKEPEGMSAVRKQLLALVDELSTMTGLPVSRFILGGFSQGAMSTCDLALSLDEAPGGLVQFSGTLLCEDRWARLAKKRAGLSVVQSHGRHDPLLSFEEAEALRDLFTEAGLSVAFVPFDGQHEIPLPALEAAGTLIGAHAVA